MISERNEHHSKSHSGGSGGRDINNNEYKDDDLETTIVRCKRNKSPGFQYHFAQC